MLGRVLYGNDGLCAKTSQRSVNSDLKSIDLLRGPGMLAGSFKTI